MKSMVLLLLALVSASPAFAVPIAHKAPQQQDIAKKVNDLTNLSATTPYATQEGQFQLRVAKAVYDVSTDLGTIAPHPLGVYLPAKALIKQVWFYTDAQFVDAGAGTVALHCEDANNLYTATDITGFAVATVTSGAATGVAANMVKAIAATCEITATVAGAAQTAGKLTVWVEYVVTL